MELEEDLDGNDRVTFDSDGDMSVGCQTVRFKMLEQMYNRAVQIRALKPKPKPKKRKARKKKATKR